MFNFENNCFPRKARRSGPTQSHLTASTAEEKNESTTYQTLIRDNIGMVAEELTSYTTNSESQLQKSLDQLIEETRSEMERAAKNLDFMAAARHRDRMYELQKLREQEK
jgi:excinuclease ABC subunit B